MCALYGTLLFSKSMLIDVSSGVMVSDVWMVLCCYLNAQKHLLPLNTTAIMEEKWIDAVTARPLFISSMEPFAIAVRSHSFISGIKLRDTEHRIVMYADDTLLLLTDLNNSNEIAVYKNIWNDRKSRIRMSLLPLYPYERGGLQWPNLQWYSCAAQIRAAKFWFSPEPYLPRVQSERACARDLHLDTDTLLITPLWRTQLRPGTIYSNFLVIQVCFKVFHQYGERSFLSRGKWSRF